MKEGACSGHVDKRGGFSSSHRGGGRHRFAAHCVSPYFVDTDAAFVDLLLRRYLGCKWQLLRCPGLNEDAEPQTKM